MKKRRFYVIRKQGDLFHRISIRFHRDAVTGEWSVSLSGFGDLYGKANPGIMWLWGSMRSFSKAFPSCYNF